MRDLPDPNLLLDWYDSHARHLPWRVAPADRAAGQIPDPYRVWLSEIMLQQTTVPAVKGYFERFTTLWPTVQNLADAEDGDVMAAWAGLGYYARARNLLKCARIIAGEFDGKFPPDRTALQKLPGIGPYTSAALSAIAFDLPETVVDGNVERVMARLFDIHTPLPTAKTELTALAATLTPAKRPGDYAQAVMDLGATICTPRTPACGLCPWSGICLARARGTALKLPMKLPKPVKPIRVGTVYIARRDDGAWLLERRPDKGLLGGMLGWPGTDWTVQSPPDRPPIAAVWQTIPGEVRHTFTHFHLRLTLRGTIVETGTLPAAGAFLDSESFRPDSLPTVMRKAFHLAEDWFPAVTG